jgi:caffeoyl-CoA O-methyltransferase
MEKTRGGMDARMIDDDRAAVPTRVENRRTCMKSPWMTAVVALTVGVLVTSSASAQPPRRSRGEGTSKVVPPIPKSPEETRILALLDELHKGPGYLKVSPEDGRLMRVLTEATDARRVVEIGTYSGYSGLWFCLALRKTGGHLTTHELDPAHADIARANFKKAGVDDLVTIVVGDAHETVKQLKDPIDVLFIDADKPGYPDYLRKLLPLVKPGGLILAHNVRSPAPDPKYIEMITTNPDLETTFLLMEDQGVSVTLKKR